MNPRIIRAMLLSLLCMATVSAVQAASTVQGRIYLKDGRVIECGEKDRIRLPKHEQDVKLLRRAFYKDKSKEIYRYEEIDSIVCWHATAPEHPRKFIPAPDAGWLWVYVETPHICVGVYSHKGYGIDSNGGIEVLVKYRYLSRSRTAYSCARPVRRTSRSWVRPAAGARSGSARRWPHTSPTIPTSRNRSCGRRPTAAAPS